MCRSGMSSMQGPRHAATAPSTSASATSSGEIALTCFPPNDCENVPPLLSAASSSSSSQEAAAVSLPSLSSEYGNPSLQDNTALSLLSGEHTYEVVDEGVHEGENPVRGNWHTPYATTNSHPSGENIGQLHEIELDQTPIHKHKFHRAHPMTTCLGTENNISLAERHIKVQNTLKEARERIKHLVLPKKGRKQVGAHILERLMQRIENRQFLHNIAVSFLSFYKKAYALTPWKTALKEVEGNFGSAVLLAFIFLRFVFFLNTMLTVLWMVSIVIPFLIGPPASFSWSRFFNTGFKNFFQGNGLEKSWIYFGGYFYTSREQGGWYKAAYMYPCTIITSLLISWAIILLRITRRLNVSSKALISSSTATHPFCTLVFGSWDFAISSQEAASRLRKNIRMRFRELLADASAHEKKLSVPNKNTKRYKRYVALGILWPLQITASVAIIVILVSQADKVNKTFKTDYAQSLLLTAVSIIAPLSIPFLVQLEDWKPAISEQVVLMKLFALRFVNVCTLYYRLYMALAQAIHVKSGKEVISCTNHKGCPDGFACCNTQGGNDWVFCTPDQVHVCMPGCMENVVAKQLLRLILTSTFVNVTYDLVYGFVHRKMFQAKRQLSIENIVIDIVYLESLVWVGSSFSPVAPVLGLFCNFITFAYMKFSLKRFYGPMKKPYSASRTSNLTHGLLLLALILCSLPASATLVQKSSGVCGPIAENMSMYDTLSIYIEMTPTLFRVFLQWLGNPAVLMGVILLLIFGLTLMREKLVQTSFSFQARYNMFTTCCLLSLKQDGDQEKIRLLSKQVLVS